ncbi:fatty acyl-CoA reductase wat-like isoform X1 [Leptopilina heterotoma]|uniref:fatty acyl-CoA reductase wat-like isoform X1 n=1 Tax=Leptopilina heterotoma TaxID=63436 RepID=UPI001CA7F63B|nr:fatty acyl-CoA reductase wat-like isoform X1 [Leptopilina heterotoma]
MKEKHEIVSRSEIQNFYAEQSILITGGTGFLGKLLIEKLLRSCPELTCIYVIVRPKKGQEALNRFEQIFEDPIFDRLKSEVPKFQHKIQAVNGDCTLPGLGISKIDREFLLNKISIVFHVAANVRFDEKLKQAVAINVNASKEIIQLSRCMLHLKSFIHVSTFYCNCVRKEIEEKFYEPPMSGDNILNLVESIDEEKLDDISDVLIGDYPNTYTYTKSIAEQVVKQYAKDLPAGIFRPAIVLSTYEEPVPGWVDNVFGPTGAMIAGGAGILRVLHANNLSKTEIVPADYTVNALIASAWNVANEKNINDEPFIYNYCSSWSSSITIGRFWQMALKYGKKVPSVKSLWCYSLTVVRNYYLYYILCLILHMIPAIVIDAGLFLTGKETKAVKIYKRIHRLLSATSHFVLHQWEPNVQRTKSLWQKISEDDKKIFPFSMDNFNWENYMESYVLGLRLYMFQDTPDTIPAAKIRMHRILFIHRIIKYLLLMLVIWGVYIVISFTFSLGWKSEFTNVSEKLIER